MEKGSFFSSFSNVQLSHRYGRLVEIVYGKKQLESRETIKIEHGRIIEED